MERRGVFTHGKTDHISSEGRPERLGMELLVFHAS